MPQPIGGYLGKSSDSGVSMSRENILILTNPSDSRNRTALYGAYLAEAMGANAVLVHLEKDQDLGYLASLYPEYESKRKELSDFVNQANEKELEKVKSFLSEKGLFVQTKSISTDSFEDSLNAFSKLRPKLIVIPREEENFRDYFLGSFLDELIRKSPLPILVHSGKEFKKIKNMMVPIALQGLSESSFNMAQEMGVKLGSQIHFIHINSNQDSADASSLIDLASDDWQRTQATLLTKKIEQLAATEVKYELRLISTDSKAKEKLLSIVEEEKPDLVVMASSGKKALQRLYLGSYCEYMVKNTNANILIVKAP